VTKTESNTPSASATDANIGNVVVLPSKSTEQRPSEKVIAFVKRHPVLTAAGGVAAGALVAALLPRRMTRGVASKALTLAEAASASTMLFGQKASEKAHELGDDAREKAHVLGDKAEAASDYAAARLEKFGLAALAAATAMAKATGKRASQLSDAASDGSAKIVDLAGELRQRVKR